MTNLADMTVTEAAAKAIELIIYGEYLKDQTKQYAWREPFTGTFEEYLEQHEVKANHRDYYGEDEDFDLDSEKVWGNFHGEGGEGTRDGWTGKLVASHGGEGEGDQYWMVISLSDGTSTRFFRKDGWYASYDGGYLDGETYEVKPQEKVITVFE